MFKTGFKQVVLNSDPGIEGVNIGTGELTGATPISGEGLYIPGYATINAVWSNVLEPLKVEGIISLGEAPTLGESVIDISMPLAQSGDVIDVKIFMTAEAVRFLPEMFSYEEIKLLTARVSDVATLAEDIANAFAGVIPDEFFTNDMFEVTGVGNILTLKFKKGYAGYSFSKVEINIINQLNGLSSGVVQNKLIFSKDFNTHTPGTTGINTGKEVESEVRNSHFENIDPYGVHFGGNDQGVDVRGIYNAYIFKTNDDQQLGWEPHAGLGYGDANTDTRYVPRDYIVYALAGSSADTAMNSWTTP